MLAMPTTAEWIGALEKCLREKWDALAEGKKPETHECAACSLAGKYSPGECNVCILNVNDGCCNDSYAQWNDDETKESAALVRDFIAAKLAELRLKHAREVCRDDPGIEKARQESIAHWKRMQGDGSSERPTMSDCALCARCHTDVVGNHCPTCPVRIRSGMDSCAAGPYKDAYSEWFYGGDATSRGFRARAQDMIDYLKEMDPKYLAPLPDSVGPYVKGWDRALSADEVKAVCAGEHSESAKPKGERVLVPFRPHRNAKSVERWLDGKLRFSACHLDRYSIREDGILVYRDGEFGGQMHEFRVPLDWRGPVPEWGTWLVPVVTGGPWHKGGRLWELWKDKKCLRWTTEGIYIVHRDRIEVCLLGGTRKTCAAPMTPDCRLHAPRGWTGPVPEGCCLLDERVPVEKVSREVMERFAGDEESLRYIRYGSNLLVLYANHDTQTWSGKWNWSMFQRRAHERRYAFLLDTDTHDHGPLDEERFFWAAGSEQIGLRDLLVALQEYFAERADRAGDADKLAVRLEEFLRMMDRTECRKGTRDDK